MNEPAGIYCGTIQPMTERRYLPDPTRVSVLTAAVLLAFALTRVLNAQPLFSILIPLGIFKLKLMFNLNTVIVLLAAGMTATGMDWLLRTHPSLEKGETREHWLLPTLTVLVIGIALYSLPNTPIWWLGFGLGAAIFLVVSLAEYVVVDPNDARYPLATAILTVLAFVIFLILAVALKAAKVRLIMVIPALFLAGALAALRTLHLRLNERWEFAWAVGIGLVAAQLGAALHYLPLTPVRFGLALLAPLYALTVLAVSLAEGNPFRRAFLEPTIMLVLFWGLAIWFR
ncbi:MAG: hypothetical protein IMZ50_10350 [Candidatus Atribacteria bacterium]|jgi:hypothetical protein|nr:hypothetical protein [Candidatus Atribacteria bacterium]